MAQKNGAKNVRVSRAKRWIYLNGDIAAITATNFAKCLAALVKESNEPIVVFLNSHGGDVFACLKIYHTIAALRDKKILVHTVGVNHVESGAFFILQAGARRCALQTTTFMFHRAVRHYTASMNTADLMAEFEDLAIIDSAQFVIYTKRGRPIREIKELFSRDATITAKQARALKLVDEIIAGKSENIPQILAKIVS